MTSEEQGKATKYVEQMNTLNSVARLYGSFEANTVATYRHHFVEVGNSFLRLHVTNQPDGYHHMCAPGPCQRRGSL
jgi:hypothetical protein